MTNEQRTSTGSEEEQIAQRLEAYKAATARKIERHSDSYRVDGRFSSGLPVPNSVNPTDLMTLIKKEQSEEMGGDYLILRGLEFEQTASELLDKYGTVELMSYTSEESHSAGKGLKRTLPSVAFDFNGGKGYLHLVQGIREDGSSMGFTLEATMPNEYDPTRIASLTDGPVPVIHYRRQLATSKQADLVMGTLNYMKQQLDSGATPANS